MHPQDIDERGKAAVRVWAKSKDGAAGAKALATHRRQLPAELRSLLVSEVAEISAELMVELLAREDGLDPKSDPVEVEGAQLHPRQAARLQAWLEDQKLTAEALGQSPEAWMKALDGGFSRYGARARGDGEGVEASPPEDEAKISRARRLLASEGPATFQARPDPSKSASAGLTGLLAAKNFGRKR